MISPVALRAGLENAGARLERRCTELNELNVFPVADGDTGSNMLATLRAGLEEADAVLGASAAELAEAVAGGAVRGARGNSGMVLSQVLRALADILAAGEEPENTWSQAAVLVREALAEPIAGTGLSVLEAVAAAPGKDAVEAARAALECTPSQLPALGGRVDAGAAGLVEVIEALHPVISTVEEPVTHADHAGQSFLEVMAYLEAPKEAMAELEESLQSLGTALVIAPAGECGAQIHIHSHRAGEVIEELFATGDVSNLRIEVLPDTQRPLIVAAAPRGSVARLFTEAGAEVIKPGSAPRPGSIYLPNGLGGGEAAESQLTVPTHTLVEGIAALAVFDPTQSAEQAVAAMRDAVKGMRTAVVGDVDKLQGTIESLLDPDDELITVLLRPGEVVDLPDFGVETTVYQADNLDSAAQVGVE